MGGVGRYFCNGEVVCIFTFPGRKADGFSAFQGNGHPFCLEPVLYQRKIIGFVWTMPGEHTQYRAVFDKAVPDGFEVPMSKPLKCGALSDVKVSEMRRTPTIRIAEKTPPVKSPVKSGSGSGGGQKEKPNV